LSVATKSTYEDCHNEALEDKIASLVSEFLKVEQSVITPTASLISLGLDSLRAVSLSRLLHIEGIFVSPIDIVQADSIRTVAAKVNSPHAHAEVPPEVELDLVKLQNVLVEELPPNDVRIDADDDVLICGATALQSGMLSQARGFAASLIMAK
jgi:ferricrocin synthase